MKRRTPSFVLFGLFCLFVSANTLFGQILSFEQLQEKIDASEHQDSIYLYLSQQQALLANSDDYILRGDLERSLGMNAGFTGSKPEEHFKRARHYYNLSGDSSKIVGSYYMLANGRIRQNDYNSGLRYLDSLLTLAGPGSEDLKLQAYTSKANAYTHLGKYPEAINELNHAKKIAMKKDDDQASLIKIYASESFTHMNNKNFEKAITQVKKIVDYYKERNRTRKVVLWTNNLVKVFDDCDCGTFGEQRDMLRDAIANAEKINFTYGKLYAYMHTARLYSEYRLNNSTYLDSTAAYLKKVDALLPPDPSPNFLTWMYEVKAGYYKRRDNYKQAIHYNLKALELWKKLDNISGQEVRSLKLHELYEKTGNYKKAYYYSKQHKLLSDSLNNKTKIEKAKELELTADFERKQYQDSIQFAQQQELATLVHERDLANEKQKQSYMYFGLLFLALTGASSFYAFRKKKEQSEILTEKNEQIEEALEEKQLLLKEIHHRVKNNFQVVSSLLELQSGGITDEKALELTKEGQNRVKAMALIHEKLYQNESGKVNFDEYIKLLVKELEALHKDLNQVKVEVDTENMLFDLDTAVPLGLIVNELVTNAYKYAFSNLKENKLKVAIHRVDEDHYKLKVADNGPGLFLDKEIRKLRSLGLMLVYRLTRQLKGKVELVNRDGAEFEIVFKHIDARNRID